MAKFNEKEKIKTVNRSGYAAYAMSKKEQLVTAALATMIGETKYYGSTDKDIVQLAAWCAGRDPEFLAKLVCFARQSANMRSVSHVLTAVIAHDAHEYTRAVLRNVIVRPDDILEIMACYDQMYGKPFPNAMKREIAVQIQKFDEYQIAKYNGGSRKITFRDVLRITHPTPKDVESEVLFGRILDDTLATPYTWETELSARGNTKEVWEELIASGRVGYMALLRNLKNIVKSGANLGPVLAKLSDPEQVQKSRQLPFRFFSAYRTLKAAGCMTPEIHRALEAALTASAANLKTIPGKTLIAVDTSGSMGCEIAGKSSVTCKDIAALMGALASHICEDAVVCYFDTKYKIVRYGKYDSILEIALRTSTAGGGTDMSLPMYYAHLYDKSTAMKPFDRVIYFSDNECNRFFGAQSSSWASKRGHEIQQMVELYRKKYNREFWVHAVDLQGYGRQQFRGKNFNLIAGWSDQVLPFILLAEEGAGSLIQKIEGMSLICESQPDSF